MYYKRFVLRASFSHCAQRLMFPELENCSLGVGKHNAQHLWIELPDRLFVVIGNKDDEFI